ncbi:Glutamate receptor [Cyphomyrmex costatus]|uniref:Glutamate receptor n=1 Tax=Cyphomyrmex costatus TaxID=456900 RepID=A0A195D435_9HYME|nr:Glutamate receptor [Cyphomyrmex costatus]
MKMHSVFGVLLLIIIPVLTDKINIMKNSKMESWISTENFTTIIKKSFFYAKCCNIFLSESIYDVDTLFHQFINIYPREYVLHKIIYDCRGYFLLGPTDEEIEKAIRVVPSSLSTTEILVIINGELKNTSKLFNVSLFGNSNANIVSRSGIWTLSENYLKPRFFFKVHSYEELMSEFNIIDMKGRELQVCTFYQPPFSYLNKTIKKIIDGVEEDVFLADSDKEKDGIEMKIFLVMAEKLNFTWTIRKLKGKYRYGRRINSSYWDGGVIQLVLEKKVDLAFGNVRLTPNHYEFVNMSTPWIQMLTKFLVPRPQPITNFWAVMRPFSMDCWILVLIMIIAKSMYMYIRARVDPKFPKRFRSFFCTITELIGRLVGTWVPRNIANARFELHLWQTAGFLLVTAYCSSLAARLTNSEYEDRIDTIRQFLEANLLWGHEGPVPYWPDYVDVDDIYASQLSSRYTPVKGQEAYIHTLIEQRKFAIYGFVIDSIFFPEDDIFKEHIKNYRLMKQSTGNYYSSFVIQSWLLQHIDMVMLWLRESGIALFHLNNVMHRRISFNLREVVKEHDGFDGIYKRLGLTPLGVGFLTLIVGLLASTIRFFYELKQASNSRSIREVFRDIQKKRKMYKSSIYKKNYHKEAESIDHNSSNKNFDSFVIKSVNHTTNTESTQKYNDKIFHNNLGNI